LDYNQQGILRKEDFVNALFAVTKDTLQPAGVLAIVQQYTTSLDTVVNYQDFLKVLERVHLYLGDFGQDEAGPHLINAMREQVHARISQLSNYDRDIIDRLRKIAAQSNREHGLDLGVIF
jgi:hypothetical protein